MVRLIFMDSLYPRTRGRGTYSKDKLDALRRGIGTKIGEGTHKAGMAQPLHKWVPSIAPSGMAFYTGERFPRWKGDLFVGALRDAMLVRLRLEGEKVVREERMLQGALGRIRDVRSAPDGYLYLLNDASDGVLVRLEPAP
jgi:glucose/arabinose dehydrogenase